jgi:hypothetical protein
LNYYSETKAFFKDDWNNGSAISDIVRFQNKCVSGSITGVPSGVAFPTMTLGASYQLHIGAEPHKMPEKGAIVVTPILISGDQILTFRGCFTYETLEKAHHTAFCYFYDAKVTDINHLNYCTVGQLAD